MKHFLKLLAAMAILLSSHTGLSQEREDDHDNPLARAQWEFLRLRDPATGQIPHRVRQRELAFASKVAARQQGTGEGRRPSSLYSPWTPRGPYNVGGRTLGLAVDVGDTNVVLAGGVSGGMWRSADGGMSWSRTSSLDGVSGVSCLAQDTRPGKTGTWYYGTGESGGYNSQGFGGWYYAMYRGDGIFKSNDDGLSWTQLPSTVSATPQTTDIFDFVNRIAVDPSKPGQDVVYAAALGTIERSSDGGATWSPVLGGSAPYAGWTDIAVTSAGVLYATFSSDGAVHGIFRSADGISWTDITPAGWPAIYNRTVLAVAPSNEGTVYFLADTTYNEQGSSFWKYTYLSGDGSGAGGNWENRTPNLQGRIISYGGYCLTLGVKPDDENVVFAGGLVLIRSTTAFADSNHTTRLDLSLYAPGATNEQFHCDHHAVAFCPGHPATLYIGHDQGIHKSYDDLRDTVWWTPLDRGYYTAQFYTIAVDHGTPGNNVIIGGMQDQGTWMTTSAVQTDPWKQEFGGDGQACAVVDGRSAYYVSAQGGVAYKESLDNAGNYLASTRIDPAGPNEYGFNTTFVLDPANNNRMYWAKGAYVWRNSDLTAIPWGSGASTSINWSKLNNSAPNPAIMVSAFGISHLPANRLYYASYQNSYPAINHLYRIDNADAGDPIPVEIGGGAFPAGIINSIAVDPLNADNVLVVFSNYNVQSLFWTTDGGATWTPVGGNLEEHPDGTGDGPSIRSAAIVPGAGYFVGTSTGIYSTVALHGMSTVWIQEGAGVVGNAIVDMLDARVSDAFLVAGTHGDGAFSATVTGTNPDPPALLLPPDGDGATPASVLLTWRSVPAAERYHLQVYADSLTPLALVFDDSTLTDTTHALAGLLTGHTYIWRVSSRNIVGEGRYAPEFSFSPGSGYSYEAGWNLISVPRIVPDGRKAVVFPTATSNAFAYEGSYVIKDTLLNRVGYWLKFGAPHVIAFAGETFLFDTVNVSGGWNIIGAPSEQVPADRISAVPPAAIVSLFFGYDGSAYAVADTLKPGEGYWVKVDQSGHLVENGAGTFGKAAMPAMSEADWEHLNRLTIRDDLGRKQRLYFTTGPLPVAPGRCELPPAMPGGDESFDARFASGRYAEPEITNAAILMRGKYPMTIGWSIIDGMTYTLAGKEIGGTGEMTIPAAQARILLSQGAQGAMPDRFGLAQNYPNPFNPSTVLRYQIPVESRITLKIFNVLGQMIETLENEVQPAGFRQVEWNAVAGVPSGVYFCRLEAVSSADPAKRFVATRKLILQR